MSGHSLLAAIDLTATSKVPKLVASDLILIIGIAALVFGAIVTWAVFLRGASKHPEEKNRPKFSPTVTVTEEGLERRRKKRRVRRRDHRQRNPTLAQTGGLPPPRDVQSSPSI